MNCRWIIISTLALTWTEMEFRTLSKPELADMKRKWDECCKTNVCLQNSCYTAEWKASGWATVRQRCQGRYPNWPYTVDIFRIQNQTDIEILTQMFQLHSEENSSFPQTIWTSGTRCPKTGNEGPVLVTRWVSTNHPLPDWLEEKTATPIPNKNDGCKFLVIYPAPNVSHTQYDFQDPTARHAAICEFLFPGDLKNPSEDGTDSTETYVSTETTAHSLSPTWMPNESKASKPTGGLYWSSSKTQTTRAVTHVKTEPYQMTFTTLTDGDANEIFPTQGTRFCKGRTEAGILWPDALPGVIVNQSCPEGMIGYAQWTCSEWTLHYTPSRPHIQDCKHIWIRNLEDDVNEGVDAVVISLKLANETKHQALSHGDITALVNLSTQILSLYYEQSGMEDPETSYSFTGSMIVSMSNILRAEMKTAWEVLPEIHQTKAASQILKLVTNMGSSLSCTRRSTDNLQFTVTAENIGLQTFILNNHTSDDGIVFPQKIPGVETTNSLSLPSDLDTKNWLSPCKNYKTAVGVIYNHVGDFLKDDNLSGSTVHVVTKVISFSLTNESLRLPKGKEVTVVLQHLLQKDIPLGLLNYPRCMFWNFSKQTYGQWDGSGCYAVDTNQTHTVCSCNHLTNFAVLMDINDNIQEDPIQSIMTYVCCGVSSLTLLGTMICFLTIRSLHGRRSIITGNLCLCLLFTNLLIIFGLDQTQKKTICATIAGLLHFWILSAFYWMLVEGYHLYKMVVLVFQRGENLSMKFYYLFAYGSPLIVVGISASIRPDGYGGHNYCWLSSHHGLMWSFVGPACAIILINIGIFILTLRSASSVRIKREQTTLKKIKSWARGSLSVMCLLGLTWCLGLFYVNKTLHVFSYIFIVLNGLQGVFIFVFHILLNDKIQTICFMKRKKQPQWIKQISSNRTNSKISTRTSFDSNGCAPSTRSRTISNIQK